MPSIPEVALSNIHLVARQSDNFERARNNQDQARQAISGAIIAAIVIPIVIFLCMVGCGVWFCCSRKKRNKKREQEVKEAQQSVHAAGPGPDATQATSPQQGYSYGYGYGQGYNNGQGYGYNQAYNQAYNQGHGNGYGQPPSYGARSPGPVEAGVGGDPRSNPSGSGLVSEVDGTERPRPVSELPHSPVQGEPSAGKVEAPAGQPPVAEGAATGNQRSK